MDATARGAGEEGGTGERGLGLGAFDEKWVGGRDQMGGRARAKNLNFGRGARKKKKNREKNGAG